jgi:hypothetical protein
MRGNEGRWEEMGGDITGIETGGNERWWNEK